MATKFGRTIYIFCIICWIQGIYGETCYEYSYSYSLGYNRVSRTFYCSSGCCGFSTNRYCCTSYSHYDDWDPIGAIIGGVVGGLVLLALLITCCVCICVKNKGRPGRIVAPTAAAGGPMVIMSQSNQQAGGYGYQPMPQYQYGTGQTGAYANPGVASSSGQVPPPGPAVPPPYPGPSGGSFPADGGEKSANPS